LLFVNAKFKNPGGNLIALI